MISILVSFLAMSHISHGAYVMYLTGQHNIVPESKFVSEITHVALAFMGSSRFNAAVTPSEWPLFTTVEKTRQNFANGTSIMVAIGGWGDTEGFSVAAGSDEGRRLFAKNVRAMVDFTGADGVDIDWEYPGGNGEDYKNVPNSQKTWEIEAYPKLLFEIRSALGTNKIISAAVPGLPRDMIAFTKDTIPRISESLDFLNIMTYDLMNRRDSITKHHTGVQSSLDSINAYLENGVPAEMLNLGFAFYVKWFKTEASGGCNINPIGCRTVLMEDPLTGSDLGQAGAFSWHDQVPPNLKNSFDRALKDPQYDEALGGTYYWDMEENIWWSWDCESNIKGKISKIKQHRGLGGVFAWGLGEDAPHFSHLKALNSGMASEISSSLVSEPVEQHTAYFKDEL